MDDISDGARRIGITTTEFQKIGNAAQLVGTSVEAVNKAMIRAGVAASKAARDGGDMVEVFKRANLDPAKFSAAGLEERIKMVAEAQRAANGDAEKMNKLFEAIGVKAAGIDFASLADEMANVSAASDETVQALARANDELDKAKHSATIFGANLLKGISDAGERLGSLLGGGGGKTIAEMDAEQARQNAIVALKNRGELLPDDSITKTVQKFVGGPVPATVQESVPGPNAQENERRINDELEKMRKETEGSRQAMRGFVDELDDSASAADKTLERLERQSQLLDESYAKRRSAYEIETALTEARLSGNKALEESILQAQDFNQVLQDTNSFETAANVAFVRAAKRRSEQENDAATTQGGFSSNFNTAQNAQTVEERIAAMRGAARSAAATAAAGRFEAAGQFRSAVRAQDRAQRNIDRAMESARVKDILGGKNMGEAYQDYVKTTGMDRMSRQEFEKSIRDQAKTPEERARAEEEAKNKSGKQAKEGGKSADQMQTVTDIYKLLTERLPIRVLAA